MLSRLDPRTPVLVGGGQVSRREDPLEPVDLMAIAASLAAGEAGAPDLLKALDAIFVVGLLSWRYRDPGALLGERIGAQPRRTAYTGDSGSNPQALVHRAAADIAAGRTDVVLIGGAESWRTRMRLHASGERPAWTQQDEAVSPAEILIPSVPMRFDGQLRAGLDRPLYAYPLAEQALRLTAGRSRHEHQRHIGELWSGFSKIGARNPHAWLQQAFTAEQIATPSPGNRMVAYPYTKLLSSNNAVDQGAVILLCSAEAAERHGISRERWVFPVAGAEANDRYDLGERDRLDRSPAIRAASRAVLALAGTGPDEVDLVDLYSCFPSAVQVAAAEIGLPLDDPSRPLTVTGGLTFAGGPWSNYVTHSVATVTEALRQRGAGTALVTANGGYLTKHALGVYSLEPPGGGYRWVNVQDEADKIPARSSLADYDGPAVVESWTLTYDRGGEPERVIASVLTPQGARAFAYCSGDEVEAFLDDAVASQTVVVRPDGSLALAG